MSTLRVTCFIALMGGLLQTATVAADDAVADTSATTDTPSLSEQMIESLVTQGWSRSTGDDGSIYVLPPRTKLPVKPTVTKSLGDQLEQHGWIATTADDGSTIYRQPEAPAAIASAEAVGEASTQTPAEQLRQQLEAHGWASSRADDGSSIYRPPAPPSAASKPTLADQVRNALEQQGWVATVAPDGSQIYRAPVQPDAATDPVDIADAPDTVTTGASETASVGEQLRRQLEAHGWVASPAADGSVVYHRPVQGPVQPVPPLAERISQALQQQGWTATTEDDGSVVYRSPGLTTEPSAAATTPPTQDDMAQQLRQRLEARGWTAAPAPNGGIYLLPPEIAAGSSTPAETGTQAPVTAEAPGDPQGLDDVQAATQANAPVTQPVVPAEPAQVDIAAPVPQPPAEPVSAAVSQPPAAPAVPVAPTVATTGSQDMAADQRPAAPAVAATDEPPVPSAPDQSDEKVLSAAKAAVEKSPVTERDNALAGHSSADPTSHAAASAPPEPHPAAPVQTAESAPHVQRQSPAYPLPRTQPPQTTTRPYRPMQPYPQSVYRVPPSWYAPPPVGYPYHR